MKTIRLLSSASAPLLAVLAFSATLLAPPVQDPPRVQRQELYNCEVQVKPLVRESGAVVLETQVYYSDWSDPAEEQYGTEFFLHVPDNGQLVLGDSAGREPTPGGGKVDLEWDTKYFVRLYWDEGDDLAFIQLVTFKDGVEDVKARKETTWSGTFDALATMSEPTVEVVRNEESSKKDRIRITANNYGMGIAFTLEDA